MSDQPHLLKQRLDSRKKQTQDGQGPVCRFLHAQTHYEHNTGLIGGIGERLLAENSTTLVQKLCTIPQVPVGCGDIGLTRQVSRDKRRCSGRCRWRWNWQAEVGENNFCVFLYFYKCSFHLAKGLTVIGTYVVRKSNYSLPRSPPETTFSGVDKSLIVHTRGLILHLN